MKEAVAAYLLAVGLHFALLWQETSLSSAASAMLPRPALMRLYEGTRVAVTLDPVAGPAYRVGLLVGDGLYLGLADEFECLFPDTARWERLEPPVTILN